MEKPRQPGRQGWADSFGEGPGACASLLSLCSHLREMQTLSLAFGADGKQERSVVEVPEAPVRTQS